MTTSLDPSGPGASRTFQVENTGGESAAIDVAIYRREMDANGTEKLEKAEETERQFLVYPPQLILGPNEKRAIRVTWVGDPEQERELAYRIVAEQLPVDTRRPAARSGGAVINVLLKYVGAIYITPKEARPEVKLKEYAIVGEKTPMLSLTFENAGTAHKVLSRPYLRISSLTLKPEDLPDITGQNILAKKSRRFLIPWPKSLPQKPLKVDFEIKD